MNLVAQSAERMVSYAGTNVLLTSTNVDMQTFAPPAITGFSEEATGDYVASIVHRESDTFSVKAYFSSEAKDVNHIFLEGPSDMLNAIFFLGELAAEGYRQAHQGGALVHAAAIGDATSHNGVLILGEKGGGKTTATIRSCVQNDSVLIGNDQIVLGSDPSGLGLQMIEGSKQLTIRQSATRADAWLDKALQLTWPVHDQPYWDNKQEYDGTAIGIRSATEPYIVSGVVKLCIDRTESFTKIVQKSPDDLSTILFLVERFKRLISGTTTPIITDGRLFLGSAPNMDTPQAEKNRMMIIQKMFSREVGVWNIYTGSSQDAVDEINKILTRA